MASEFARSVCSTLHGRDGNARSERIGFPGEIHLSNPFSVSGNHYEMRRNWRVRALRLPLVRTLEADPAWKFDGASRRGGVAWRGRYEPMELEAIMKYPLPPLADDARLFLWRVGAMQQEALDVIKAWGFTLKSEIVWIKTTDDGKLILDTTEVGNGEVIKQSDLADHGIVHHGELANLAFGAGHQTRYAHETCLIATRGNPERTEHFRSVFFAPRGEHSEKPAKFYEIVERMSPGPRYRMFACGPRDGWTSEYHMAHRGEFAQNDGSIDYSNGGTDNAE